MKEVPAMTAVIYARYSSDNQREESIEGQIRECTAYAEKNGIMMDRFAAKTRKCLIVLLKVLYLFHDLFENFGAVLRGISRFSKNEPELRAARR